MAVALEPLQARPVGRLDLDRRTAAFLARRRHVLRAIGAHQPRRSHPADKDDMRVARHDDFMKVTSRKFSLAAMSTSGRAA